MWDFIVKLLKLLDYIIGQIYNSILIIVNKFTKWGYFIAYKKSISAEKLLKVYIKEVFAKYKVLIKIISNKDVKFILIFWETFIAK